MTFTNGEEMNEDLVESANQARSSRNRKSHSCTECRRRKKHCDRKIPGCNQCKLRGTEDQCKWGDERDEIVEQSGTRQRFSPYHRNDQIHSHQKHHHQDLSTRTLQEQFQKASRLHQYDERAALLAELAEADNNLGTRVDDSSTPEIEELRHSKEGHQTYTPSWNQNHSYSHEEVQGLLSIAHTPIRSPSSAVDGNFAAPMPPPSQSHHRPSSRSSRATLSESMPTSTHSAPLSFDIRLTIEQARELLHLHRFHEMFPDKMLTVDSELVSHALEGEIAKGSKSLHRLRFEQADIFALLMMICASTMTLLPPTYCITLGIRTRYEQIDACIDEMHKAAEEAIDSLPVPTLLIIQAGSLYLHNLTQRCSAREHIARLDFYIRAARRLGLDQLGSPEDDERIWSEMDTCDKEQNKKNTLYGQKFKSSSSWAAFTLKTRNRKERNLGRVHWSFITAKDWVASRLSGCYQIHPNSFTTSLPRPYKESSNDYVTEKLAVLWDVIWIGAENAREYADLTAKAECLGEQIDYDDILRMDATLKLALDKRPNDLRPEDANMKKLSKPKQYYALLISCSIWHRLFVIHRPFLMLSQLEPERYGLSASRSWYYARLTIRTVREASQSSLATVKQVPMHFRLLQASLVIISHLFLWPQSPSLPELVDIHEDLHFCIEALKGFESSSQRSMFAGQSARLEALLAAASRIKRNKKQNDGLVGNVGSPFGPWTGFDRPGGEFATNSIFQMGDGGTQSQSDDHSILHQSASIQRQTQDFNPMTLPQSRVNPDTLLNGGTRTETLADPTQFSAMDALDDQLLKLMGDRSSVMPTSSDDLWTEIFKFLDSNALQTPPTNSAA